MTKRRSEDGLSGFVEWQDHQYDPGHWTGGNRHPIYRRGKGSRRYGYMSIALGVFLIMVSLLVFVISPLLQGGIAEVVDALPALALVLLAPVLFIVIGLRYVVIGKEFEQSAERRQRSRKKRQKYRKQE